MVARTLMSTGFGAAGAEKRTKTDDHPVSMSFPPRKGAPERAVVRVRKQDHHTVLDLLPPIWGASSPAVFVHADSHADLDIPDAFTHDVCKMVAALPDGLTAARKLVQGGQKSVCDISSWLMPLVALRVVGTVVFIRPWWQTDGGDESAPDGTYELMAGWTNNGELRVTSEDGVPDRISYMWRDCGTWSDEIYSLQDTQSFRLVLAQLPGPSMQLPPSAELMLRDVLRSAVMEGARVCLHVDLDVHSTINPVHARFVAAFGDERANALHDAISARDPTMQHGVLEAADTLWAWESTGEQRESAADYLAETVVAGDWGREQLEWLRRHHKPFGSWAVVREHLAAWSLRWAPHHPSTPTEVAAVSAALRHVHWTIMSETQQLPLVTMCTSLGDFLPQGDLPGVEAQLGWMDQWYIRQKGGKGER